MENGIIVPVSKVKHYMTGILNRVAAVERSNPDNRTMLEAEFVNLLDGLGFKEDESVAHFRQHCRELASKSTFKEEFNPDLLIPLEEKAQ